jgi:hypothetical protein
MTRSRILILVLFLFNCFALVAQQNTQQQRNNVNLQLSAEESQIKRIVIDTSQSEFGGNFMDKTLDGSNTIDFTFYLNKPKLFLITSIIPQSLDFIYNYLS